MSETKWEANAKLIHQFQAIGRALLSSDMEDSHSGNIARRWVDDAGRERLVITSTGSQKGDLEASDICILSTEDTDYGYYKASSETDIHARILNIEGIQASLHAHTKDLTIVTFDDEEKPNKPAAFLPVDPLGYYHMNGRVPVDWVAVPSGSAEMVKVIQQRLGDHRVTVIQGHGAFVKGRTLEEALWLACIANNSGYIARLMERIGVDLAGIRKIIQADPDRWFSHVPDGYVVEDNDRCDFPHEEELVREFRKTGARLFESRLSPFHTGSLSVRGINSLLYAPKGAMPRDLAGPLMEVPLEPHEGDSRVLQIHKALYAESNFQTIAHCYVPEAEVLANFVYPGEEEPDRGIVAIDAEGSFLYLVVPVVGADVDIETLLKLLHDYKVVVVRGGGVWAVGMQSLSEVLHHPSSVREICLYRIGAFERGLDLRALEPEKAKRW